MRFKSYPKCKPSGVEWLGDVPEHWNIRKFRFCFTESTEKIESLVIGVMLSVSGYRGIEVKEYDDENRRRMDEDLVGYRVVHEGQLVVNTMWLNYAGLGVSPFEGYVSPAYRSYWIDQQLHKKFIHHLLRSAEYVKGYTKFLTGIRPNSLQMSRDDLMVFPILLPSPKEQIGIATFLDRETAKVDTLITKQEKLIELLKEKRQSVISHVVAKGLNPNVKMKDSGIEWLGNVPEHWDVKKLKYIVQSVESGVSVNATDTQASPNENGVLKTSCVYGDKFRPEENKTVWELENERLSCPVKKNSLIVSRMNTPALVGSCGYVDNDFPNLYLPDRLWMISFEPAIAEYITKFVWYVLTSDSIKALLPMIATGTSDTMKNISQGDFMSLTLPIPPIQECIELVKYLEASTAKFDELIAKAEQAIVLQREHRAALISAAVTGKIDVREAA